MANFHKTSLSSLISLCALSFFFFIFPPVLSSHRPTHLLRNPQNAPRFLGKFSRSNYTGPIGAPSYQYETRYFDQNIDHFAFSSLPKFRQRYLINTEYWSGPDRLGPIFLYCGNEGDIEWFAANTGLVWELAPRFQAMVIFPEHRYYGESMPYGSIEEAYKNATTLAHLTAEQALADFAVLVTELKRNLSAQACPVVLFGGSYGGMLAAWMRLKYPHIAIGALASSAPVLQFEDLVPTETFYDIVSNDFRRESVDCFNTIKDSWDVIESEGHNKSGLSYLTETFRFCNKLESSDKLSNWLSSAYSYLAMGNYPYPSDFLMPMPRNPIKEVCKKIDNSPNGTSILQRIFKGVSIYYNYTGTVGCFDLDDDPHGTNGWNWQACTEMVMPMSSSKHTSMFPEYKYDYSSDEEWCLENYNVKPRPTWITTQFGGHGFKNALKNFGSNIIFSNGLLDPWSGGSVLENISETIVALVTEKESETMDINGTPRPPFLSGTNYSIWKQKMRWFIKNIDERAWRAVITQWEKPMKKGKDGDLVPKREDEWDQNDLTAANWNSKTMNTICSFIDIRYYKSIQRCESAKDAWDTLEKLCLGTAGVKKSRLRVLSTQFETIRMEENELINDYAMRLQEISGEMTELGENVTNERLVGKLLRSITRKFDTKITAIEEARDTSTLPYEELVGSLNTYEMEHIRNREKNTAYTSNESFEYDSDDEEMSRAVLSLKNTPLNDDELSFITNRFRNYIKKKSNTGGNRFKSDISRPTGRSVAKPQNTDLTSNPSKPLSEVQCHECKGWGHYKNECANILRKKNLIAQEFDENSEEEEDEEPQALVMAKATTKCRMSHSSPIPEAWYLDSG
ncbi:hypothetical protein CASFOL_015329 [Castilleja foliolosa]|uniref:Uncharacterized protein n=1 Tax=Castilleja foliolosa TaxID=1961234 RepID=A0ABD3DHD5_9LAMI